MDKLCFDLPALLSMHRFGDAYEQAITEMNSELVSCEVLRQAPDAVGQHWYGMRVRMTTRKCGLSFYLHTGLIFLPETKIGLMVEVDQKNNLANYECLVRQLESCGLFTVNRAEPEYLKLFMPDDTFAAMNAAPAAEQKAMLKAYFTACAEEICRVAEGQAFRLNEQDLLHAVYLGRAFREVVVTSAEPDFTVQINEKDPDNFGQYAMGYRYHLINKNGTADMYAYFGAIYSYKKRPAGIFTEIDWFSNQSCFDHVKANFQADPAFEYSSKEEKFIKLFMPQAQTERFNNAPYDEQLAILKEFFTTCSRALAAASE